MKRRIRARRKSLLVASTFCSELVFAFFIQKYRVVVLFCFLTIRNVRRAVFASAASNLHFVFQ